VNVALAVEPFRHISGAIVYSYIDIFRSRKQIMRRKHYVFYFFCSDHCFAANRLWAAAALQFLNRLLGTDDNRRIFTEPILKSSSLFDWTSLEGVNGAHFAESLLYEAFLLTYIFPKIPNKLKVDTHISTI
jgi:hypothetical protein